MARRAAYSGVSVASFQTSDQRAGGQPRRPRGDRSLRGHARARRGPGSARAVRSLRRLEERGMSRPGSGARGPARLRRLRVGATGRGQRPRLAQCQRDPVDASPADTAGLGLQPLSRAAAGGPARAPGRAVWRRGRASCWSAAAATKAIDLLVRAFCRAGQRRRRHRAAGVRHVRGQRAPPGRAAGRGAAARRRGGLRRSTSPRWSTSSLRSAAQAGVPLLARQSDRAGAAAGRRSRRLARAPARARAAGRRRGLRRVFADVPRATACCRRTPTSWCCARCPRRMRWRARASAR